MNSIYKYPDRYAIHQAMSEFTQRTFLDQFAQSRGIFITNVNQNSLSQFLANLFFDLDDLEEIRKAALNIQENNTLSGFLIRAEDADFDLLDTLSNLRNQVVDTKNIMTVGSITQGAGDQAVYQGKITYTQNRPGRVEFLQGTERSFEYYFRRKSSGFWEVLIDGSTSNDARVFEGWLEKRLPRNSDIQKVDQEKLTTAQSIKFFDELSHKGVDENWRLVQVKRLVLRGEADSDPETEPEEIDIAASTLTGITQAILEGNELRNNSFVKQCERDGYRFTAMTFEYEHKTRPLLKEMRAEFKKKPKVFEVSLAGYYKRQGLGAQAVQGIITEDERFQELANFWKQAKNVFDAIVSSKTSIIAIPSEA